MNERAKDTFGGKAKGKKANHRQLMLLNGRIDDLWRHLIEKGRGDARGHAGRRRPLGKGLEGGTSVRCEDALGAGMGSRSEGN